MKRANLAKLLITGLAVLIVGGMLIIFLASNEDQDGQGVSTLAPKQAFIEVCNASSPATGADCGCMVTQLERAGYRTEQDWSKMMLATNGTQDPTAAPIVTDYNAALAACRR